MQNSWRLALAVVSLLYSSGPCAGAKLFRYRLASYPKSTLGCEQEVQRLRRVFEESTGNRSATARCLGEDEETFDLEISYSSDAEIYPASTVDVVADPPLSNQGVYDSKSACEDALPSQRDLFEAKTGLDPIVAFCYRESEERRSSWVLRIDAFGKPRQTPFLSYLELFGAPLGDAQALQAQLSRYASAKIPGLASLALRPYLLGHDIRALYFGVAPLPLVLEPLGSFDRREECERASSELVAPLATLDPVPPVLCTKLARSGSDRTELQLFQVETGTYLEPVRYPKFYATEEDCRSDGPAVLGRLGEGSDGKAIAAICHPAGPDMEVAEPYARMTVLVRHP